jgi:hypothetical protein
MIKRKKKSHPTRPIFCGPPPVENKTPPILGAKQRHDGWTPERRVQFFEMMAGRCSIEEAATAVGMTERSAYALRARDPDFAESWNKAREAVRLGLIDQSMVIAQHGRITRILQNGKIVGDSRWHSPALVLAAVKRVRSKKLLGKPVVMAAALDFGNCLDLLKLGLAYPDPDAPPAAVPVPPPHEGRGWSYETQSAFCDALSTMGDVDKVCQSLAKSRNIAYDMRTSPGCEAFAIAWDAAIIVFTEKLVMLAMGLAREGSIREIARCGKITSERRQLSAAAQQHAAVQVEELALPVVRISVTLALSADDLIVVELTRVGVAVVEDEAVEVDTEPVLKAA